MPNCPKKKATARSAARERASLGWKRSLVQLQSGRPFTIGVWPSGRAPASGAGDRRFDPDHPDHSARRSSGNRLDSKSGKAGLDTQAPSHLPEAHKWLLHNPCPVGLGLVYSSWAHEGLV